LEDKKCDESISVILLQALLFVPALAHIDHNYYDDRQDITIKVTQVSGNVYMLQGRGGNIGALNGPEGILIVDDDYKAVSEKLRDALKELGSPTPRFIFNTHWHGDHTEGNLFFGHDSIVVAQTNVRKRLSSVNTVFGQTIQPYPSYAWPMVTYDESLTIHLNGEDVRAVHYPNGHTDGDTVIFFTKANVVHLGDDFFVGRFPFVDLESGGSVQGVINNVAAILKEIPADAKLIPGHGPLSTVADLKTYHDTLAETAKIVLESDEKEKDARRDQKGRHAR
jgi:glyoxylase-like metal-dependent hydrolase (beta-lactamase superfamily II)